MLGAWVAFLVATMAVFVDPSIADSRLSLQCKNIARDVIINSCKGPRNKRSMDRSTDDKVIRMSRLIRQVQPEFDAMDTPSRARELAFEENRIRVVRSNGFLGFSLTSEELEELYQEIGYRMPRDSKELNKRIFQYVASRCCPSVKLCYDFPNLIPCMGYD